LLRKQKVRRPLFAELAAPPPGKAIRHFDLEVRR
jgi:hypothetical protein